MSDYHEADYSTRAEGQVPKHLPEILAPTDIAHGFVLAASWAVHQPDSASKASAAYTIILLAKELERQMSEFRQGQIRLLNAQGWSVRELAEAFDRHPSRIQQILKGE